LKGGVYEMYSNERNCVVMRRGEKQVLRWYVRLAEQGMELLNKPWSVVKKLTAKCAQSSEPLDYYIAHVIVPLVKKA
jgi:hypothetical protein